MAEQTREPGRYHVKYMDDGEEITEVMEWDGRWWLQTCYARFLLDRCGGEVIGPRIEDEPIPPPALHKDEDSPHVKGAAPGAPLTGHALVAVAQEAHEKTKASTLRFDAEPPAERTCRWYGNLDNGFVPQCTYEDGIGCLMMPQVMPTHCEKCKGRIEQQEGEGDA